MFQRLASSPASLGAFSAICAASLFSVNDMTIKFLSGGYALHEVVLFRSAIGLIILMLVIAPLNGGLVIMRTNRLGMHLIRGFLVVFANMTFFLGLAALPLAEAVAIFFISPLVITIFSIFFLGETVGPRRWAAILVGLIGVGIMTRPGTAAFQIASLLPIAAAIGYAGLHMLTRVIGKTESAATMSFYIQLTFVIVCVVIGLAVGDGRFDGQQDPSLHFMLRAWEWPQSSDFALFLIIGTASAFGGYFISQAYRVAEAALVAPFEYLALPLALLWGYFIFDEVPDGLAILGIILIVGSGLFTIFREAKMGREGTAQTPRYRR